MDGSGVAGICLVVAGGDGPELLQLGEGVLDEVAPAIHVAVEVDLGLAVGLRRYTATAPRASRSALSHSTSKALSPSRAPKATPSISGGTPTVSWRGGATGRSAPGCRVRRPGRRAWWSDRRANAQWPGFGSPPCATRLLVGGDNGAVDKGVFEVRLVRQAGEDALEYAALHPAAKRWKTCSTCRKHWADRAKAPPPAPAIAPLPETADCPSPCRRDRSVSPAAAAPPSPKPCRPSQTSTRSSTPRPPPVRTKSPVLAC